MPSILQVLNKIDSEGFEIGAFYGNKHIMEISAKTKRKPAWVKLAITEEVAQKLMSSKIDIVLCLLDLPLDALKKIINPDTNDFYLETKN